MSSVDKYYMLEPPVSYKRPVQCQNIGKGIVPEIERLTDATYPIITGSSGKNVQCMQYLQRMP